MLRFAKNRWWAFILTLSLLLTGSATFASLSYGDGIVPIANPDTPPAGDPDTPVGPSKQAPGKGRAVSVGSRYADSSMGDGVSARSVWVWRLHVVLRSLIIRYSR